MCIILIGNITERQHKLAKQQNPDGFSLFTKELGLIKAPVAGKVQQALETFGIWHYRIGTSGKKDKLNIHPFPVCGGKYLLYHNGILGDGLGDMSDTRALAMTLQNVSFKSACSVLKALENRQRFVLVDAKDPTRFTLFGEWVCDAGVLMSHTLVAPRVYYTPVNSTGHHTVTAQPASKNAKPSIVLKNTKVGSRIYGYADEGGWDI